VEHHVELGAVEEGIVPAQDLGHEDEVRRRRDRQELGESLHDPNDYRLKKSVHGPASGTVSIK
jgi:hypothetical protein